MTSAGAVLCWGRNFTGQLGDGSTSDRPTPVAVSGLGSGVTAIAAGGSHTCALTIAGAVQCWGNNSNGQLGDSSTTQRQTPVSVSGLGGGVTAIAAGDSHTCAVTGTGVVMCWGRNANGQLGDGSTAQRVTPVGVSGLGSQVTAIRAGALHTCAVTITGAALCWGNNGFGQLGDGSTVQRLTPVGVSGLGSGVTAITAGSSHTCAVTSGGALRCWGQNFNGQLGDGSSTQRLTPVAVTGLGSGVAAITGGSSHTCAVTSAGAALCWGSNERGQLGDGSTTDRLTPVAVSGLGSGVAAIAAGSSHTCAVTSAGAVLCWGINDFGQLGDGSNTTNRLTPTSVGSLGSGVMSIAAGATHTCALTSAGAVLCWGRNLFGQLGNGSTEYRLAPVAVSALASGVTAIAAGQDHTCALTSAGAVLCWGRNDFGQLGDGSTTQRLTPVAVSGLGSGVIAIAAGATHTCAVTASPGAALCWGNNDNGQLGDGTAAQRLTPVPVSGLGTGVAGITAGLKFSCARRDGAALCWGSNANGQLGDGTFDPNRLTPGPVSGLGGGVAAITAGAVHTCALTSAGAGMCWGRNAEGQLGDGTTTQRQTPVAVSGLGSGVTAIADGWFHTCAVTSAGASLCWGRNDFGQLGDGSTTQRMAPVAVSGLGSGVAAHTAGELHTCAVTSAGAVLCWGSDAQGQLGDGGRDTRLPALVVVPTLFANGFE